VLEFQILVDDSETASDLSSSGQVSAVAPAVNTNKTAPMNIPEIKRRREEKNIFIAIGTCSSFTMGKRSLTGLFISFDWTTVNAHEFEWIC
jgi:hypothetical protein